MSTSRADLQNELYRLLLNANDTITPENSLNRILGLLVSISGASIGHLEIQDKKGETIWTSRIFNKDGIKNMPVVFPEELFEQTIKKKDSFKPFLR